MVDTNDPQKGAVLAQVVSLLQGLPDADKNSVLRAAAVLFGVSLDGSSAQRHSMRGPPGTESTSGPDARELGFPEEVILSAKQFLMEKGAQSDVERIACLAFYLTHYKDTPFFKTLDLTRLNTEAAQPKFSNAAYTSNNAVKMGYLAPATQGRRQLSALGEQYVLALPDRERAKQVMTRYRARRRARRDTGGAARADAEDASTETSS